MSIKIQESDHGTEFIPRDSMVITDPSVINQFQHSVKLIILENLYAEAKTIMQLHKDTKYNPGTIKRHLKDLEEAGLITLARKEMSEKRIIMKFYRVTAREFIIQYRWP
ncbi:ArsR family transcriptional regulator [Promethearchaeum syntrophicum]|uniref:ArsR family transcriptional regulator n=1 Tax=Promethearchaeum syntrophicum TaxID=2594042 RepID=A0A5B9DEZ6_9ARCH|nr:winged helix-turn-helix domain-containing protein [Candidatus Prometheoarchaeum syntrophicum]QEE17363.1 Bacterial regulatory protein, arsR family [Candidatus Prometheoarchaeum syntrophicum]